MVAIMIRIARMETRLQGASSNHRKISISVQQDGTICSVSLLLRSILGDSVRGSRRDHLHTQFAQGVRSARTVRRRTSPFFGAGRLRQLPVRFRSMQPSVPLGARWLGRPWAACCPRDTSPYRFPHGYVPSRLGIELVAVCLPYLSRNCGTYAVLLKERLHRLFERRFKRP